MISPRARNEKGASAVEYGLLVAAIGALIVAATLAIGGFFVGFFGDEAASSVDAKPTPPLPNTDPHKGWVVISDDKDPESDAGRITTMIRCYDDRLVVLTRSPSGVAQSTEPGAIECT